MDPAIITNLRTALASLYTDETSMRRVVESAGIDLSRIAFGSSAQNNWYSIFSEARKMGRIDALLRVVESEYPDDVALRAACDRYRRAAGGSAGPAHNEPAPRADAPTLNELVPLLTPFMADESQRRALVQLAVGNSPVSNQIYFGGAADTFTIHLVQTLMQFGDVAQGESALGALLKVCRSRVGVDRQRAFDEIIARLD